MLYCSTQRIESLADLLRAIAVRAPARFSLRSAMTNANAFSLKTSDCREAVAVNVAFTVPEAPRKVSAALLPGAAVTVCNCPEVIIDGEMLSVAVDVPDTAVVMTKSCSVP